MDWSRLEFAGSDVAVAIADCWRVVSIDAAIEQTGGGV